MESTTWITQVTHSLSAYLPSSGPLGDMLMTTAGYHFKFFDTSANMSTLKPLFSI